MIRNAHPVGTEHFLSLRYVLRILITMQEQNIFCPPAHNSGQKIFCPYSCFNTFFALLMKLGAASCCKASSIMIFIS
jgi:hypothetical protein